MVGALADVLDKEGQEVGPLVTGKLDDGDGGDDLGSGSTGLDVGGAQGLQGKLLNLGLGLVVCLLQPF